jgi:hypothetical protein
MSTGAPEPTTEPASGPENTPQDPLRGDGPEMFDREYVRHLRSEAGRYRTERNEVRTERDNLRTRVDADDARRAEELIGA